MESEFSITPYMGITVMIPALLLVAAWLNYSASRGAAQLWLLVVALAYGAVMVSKVAFKGWGHGLETLNIAVFSGHAMNACLVLPVFFSLLVRQWRPWLRWPVALAALVWGWYFAITIVAPTVHPVSEAIAGALIGSLGSLTFLALAERVDIRPLPGRAMAMGFTVIAVCASFPKYTAEGVLNHFAIILSGAEEPYIKPHWHQSPTAQSSR
ncbi:phosphatase PAP2 family protein [Pseudomonas turukhanskensis]|uniref:phosphatase PAP2 family protein n=1 Tax=Pseudomonas turukhanskensis TaxID=1806536 RepID=UPI0022F33DCA|nr:phosphatase PAP2 family protein [Pseudomonas turukhanskensis]